VSRCLEKRPDDRFTSAHDLAFALQALEESSPRDLPRPRKPRSGGPQGWAAAALGVVVLTAAGWWLATRGRAASLPEFHPRRVAGQLGSISDAALSPSGTEIAYTASDHGTSEIWVTDVRGGKPVRLTERPTQASEPAWFPDGSAISFTSTEGQATSIWKVPRFGGTPMLILQDAAQGAVSPDGSRIAFTRRAQGGFLRIWLATVTAGDQVRRVTGPDDGLFEHQRPAWSPDGRLICYSDMRDLWLVPVDGGKAHHLMKDDPEDRHPVWSVDGRYVYFSSDREGTQALWRIAAAGGQAIRVTDGTGSEQSPSLSRDGKRLAFVSRVRNGDIGLTDLRTGKTAHLQQEGYACLPAIAPDRSALVFVSVLAETGRLCSVPLQDNAPAGDPTALMDQPGDVASPAFSPDGRWVAYYRAAEGRREVWVVAASGGPPVNFSNHPGQDLQPVWSPDSAEIAFVSDRGGAYQIWVAPIANGRRVGEPRHLTFDAGAAGYPSWSPDGKSIAYVLLTEKGKEVWIASADGRGNSRRLTSGAHAFSLRWFGTSDRILVSGYWGEHLPALRLVSSETGEVRPFDPPGPATLDPEFPDFDLSRDGTLLAVFEGSAKGVIWVREVEKGSF
jgi:Tol biopolymer transport system component